MDFDDLERSSMPPSRPSMPSQRPGRKSRFGSDPPDVIRYTPWIVWIMAGGWIPLLLLVLGTKYLINNYVIPRLEGKNAAEVQVGDRPRRVMDR